MELRSSSTPSCSEQSTGAEHWSAAGRAMRAAPRLHWSLQRVVCLVARAALPAAEAGRQAAAAATAAALLAACCPDPPPHGPFLLPSPHCHPLHSSHVLYSLRAVALTLICQCKPASDRPSAPCYRSNSACCLPPLLLPPTTRRRLAASPCSSRHRRPCSRAGRQAGETAMPPSQSSAQPSRRGRDPGAHFLEKSQQSPCRGL